MKLELTEREARTLISLLYRKVEWSKLPADASTDAQEIYVKLGRGGVKLRDDITWWDEQPIDV